MLRRVTYALVVAALGCTNYVPLHYGTAPVPPRALATEPAVTPLVSVIEFEDARNISDGVDWLGAIRGAGGPGFPMKRLRTEKPVTQVVEDAFADGLRARGVYAEPGQGKVTLGGRVLKFDCNQYFNFEAHANLVVLVSETATHALIYTGTYQADQTEGGPGPDLYKSVEVLRALAERTLREAVDRALDDPKLREAVQKPR